MVDDEEIIAQRAYAITALTPPMMTANIVNSLAALLVFYLDSQLLPQAVLWAAVVISFSAYSLWRFSTYRGKPFPKRLTRRSYRRTNIRAAALGLVWAFPGAVILPVTTGVSQAFIIALAAGTVSAGAITLYPMPVAALTFSGIVAVGSMAGFALTANSSIIGFAICSVVFYFVIASSVLRHERIFVSEFKNRRALDEKNREIENLLAETRAEAIAERKNAEKRLLQAQKMEAIGQLTGGIAHDFNNLLATIQGHAELLALEPGTDRHLTDPILRSTKSGAELTRRLLAFARRQTLKPQAVDLDHLIKDMVELLRRTLRDDVRIETELPPDLWPVFADPNLLANAILNLANNARDAMPRGGKLRICVANLPQEGTPAKARDYVRITVCDTGTGMSPEVKARATEPFFTTKEFGYGSGLGLSMVHGFVEQSGGEMIIKSTPGEGTRIEIRIPRSMEAAKTVTTPVIEKVLGGSGERILIVEDNKDVRVTVKRLLSSFDYRVQDVESVAEARKLLDTVDAPDVILSDIVLPGGTSGVEFAKELAATRPEIGVLLMSGYTNLETTRAATLGTDIELLPKPFDSADLAKAIYACCQRTRVPQVQTIH